MPNAFTKVSGDALVEFIAPECSAVGQDDRGLQPATIG